MIVTIQMSRKHRGWVFTINNWTDDERDALRDIDCYWLIASREVGESGTPHLQGAVEFNNPRTLRGIKQAYDCLRRAHLEPRKGTPYEAYIYCRKEEDDEPIEIHPESFPKEDDVQGKRTDLATIKRMVADPEVKLEEIWEAATSYQSYQMAVKGIALKRKPPSRPGCKVHWFWGPPGSGKSYTARQQAGPDAYYYKQFKASVESFEGYQGQTKVVFDDLRSSWMPFNRLLDLTGEDEVTVGNKGGSFPWFATEIWITSIYNPAQLYKKNKEDIKQLLRRIDPQELREFKVQDNPHYNERYDWIDDWLNANAPDQPVQAGDEYAVAMEKYRPASDD